MNLYGFFKILLKVFVVETHILFHCIEFFLLICDFHSKSQFFPFVLFLSEVRNGFNTLNWARFAYIVEMAVSLS